MSKQIPMPRLKHKLWKLKFLKFVGQSTRRQSPSRSSCAKEVRDFSCLDHQPVFLGSGPFAWTLALMLVLSQREKNRHAEVIEKKDT